MFLEISKGVSVAILSFTQSIVASKQTAPHDERVSQLRFAFADLQLLRTYALLSFGLYSCLTALKKGELLCSRSWG
jgi:hypothetical protein